jgi:hypothetical protein
MIYIYDVYAYLQDIVYVIHDTEKKLIDAGAKITDVRIIPYDKSILSEQEVVAYIYYEAEKEIEL